MQHIQLDIVVFLWHIQKEPEEGLAQQSYRDKLSMAYFEHRHLEGLVAGSIVLQYIIKCE